ncbi:MAG: ABC transporter transmembrane domain-containing protein, partial [Psychrosphaera sp.]|nr:ABC transporter transmembrane domain-containing protein [Psychrosphaera sp.]
MKFFDELSRHAPNRIFISLVMGVTAGISYTLLIPIVLNSLNSLGGLEYQSNASGLLFGIKIDNVNMAWLYGISVALILTCTTVSQIMLARISSDVTSKLRQRLYWQILNSPLASVEKVGPPRLTAALTTDVQNIVMGAKMVPMVIASIFTIISMLGFLWYLSTEVFQFVCIA